MVNLRSSRLILLNIIRKEWRSTFSGLNSALYLTLLPLIITGQALALLYLVPELSGEEVIMKGPFGSGLESWLRLDENLTEISVEDRIKLFFYGQFPLFLLLIPVMVSVSFATFSIVGEKSERTLEPLLATPVKIWQLLAGKTLAGAIPAILISWICAGLFLAGMACLGDTSLIRLVLNAQWLISLLLMVPVFSVLSFLLGVVGSTRAKDAKSAQNIVMVVLLPLLALIGVQAGGLIVFTPVRMVWMVVVMLVITWFILKLTVKLFRRESIILFWKS
jgi:ABC-2 type transport system permease protein